MATTSIWRVKGWLGKVVNYVENPEKTEQTGSYHARDSPDRDLSDVIRYAVNRQKTERTDDEDAEIVRSFVTGINCYPATAREEMQAVKRRFGKEDGTIAYHGYQSFAPGEATPEVAHEIGVKLARQLWGDRFQVIVATHLDRETHLHNHFVVNTVSFLDGKRYHRTKADYARMRALSDQLCREYRLSVIDQPQPRNGKPYGEWDAERQGKPVWRDLIRSDVDEAIRRSMTMQQFWSCLHGMGYEVKQGKHIALRPPGKERFVRLSGKLGEEYTVEAIRDRILSRSAPVRPLPVPKRAPVRRTLRGPAPPKKVTGFRALYYHYCFLLGVFPKRTQASNKRLHFLLREDLLKLESITNQTRLLARHHIDTDRQLLSYKEGLEQEIERCTEQRRSLCLERRHVSTTGYQQKLAYLAGEIQACNETLSQLRKEVRLCEEIAVRSGVMSANMQRIREDARHDRKETKQHEQFRRRGGTGR